jgi:hypothetical protein
MTHELIKDLLVLAKKHNVHLTIDKRNDSRNYNVTISKDHNYTRTEYGRALLKRAGRTEAQRITLELMRMFTNG